MRPARTPKLAWIAIAACSLPRVSRADPPAPASAPTAALAVAPPVAPPEEPGDEHEPDTIEITVRGSSAGAYVSRTSVDQSAREAVDAASLLAELPSVHVRRLGADGALATLSVRGSASTQVGVVLASIPLTSAADPSLDIGALPLWPGASFRVYRGFAPASLGTTGYLGGVLAIDPPSPLATARTEWWVGAGSFGSLKLRVGDARTIGPVSIGAGLFASRSDGDFNFEAEDPRTGALAPHDRRNAGFHAAGAIGRASVDLGWGSAGATLFADVRRQGLPGQSMFPTTFSRLDTSRIVAGADILVRTDRGAWRGALWGRTEASTFQDPLGELDPTRLSAHVESAINAGGGSLGWRGRLLDPLTVGLFMDGRGERLVPQAEGSTSATRLALGAGLELEWRPLPSLTIAASGRLDARRDSMDADVALKPEAQLDAGGFDPSGHIGASYRLSDAAVLSAHGGALFRPPSFFELFGDRGTLIGDPSLRPERGLSADAGLHGAMGDGRLEVSYELVAFATLARDLIAFVPLGLATFRARNVERASILGGELSAELRTRGLRTTLSYTLLATENLSDNPLTRGRPLPARPVHDLAYDAAYRIGPVRVRYGLDALAGTTVDIEGTRVLPARVLHSAGASLDVPFVRGLRASVEVQNLLDLRTLYVTSPLRGVPIAMPVSDFLGFPLPGRTVWASLRFVAKSDEPEAGTPGARAIAGKQ
jgi:iron complex outermembrane receptor protein